MMKKLMIISIYLVFGTALMRVAGVPAPPIAESFQAPVAFKKHVAIGSAIPASAGKETLAADRSPTSIATTTTVTWATWTATTTSVATNLATYTTSPLLDRLVKNKPSIWSNKGFYVLSGALYLTLLGLFLRQILDTAKRRP